MRWNHLPVSGGLYDQHPRLLEEWEQIFLAKGRQEREEQARRDREMKKAGRRRR